MTTTQEMLEGYQDELRRVTGNSGYATVSETTPGNRETATVTMKFHEYRRMADKIVQLMYLPGTRHKITTTVPHVMRYNNRECVVMHRVPLTDLPNGHEAMFLVAVGDSTIAMGLSELTPVDK